VVEIESLRAGVAALLDARGDAALADVVRSGSFRLLPGARRWSVGAREVDAQSFELALGADALVRLRAISGGADRVKDALGEAVGSAATMLDELHVVLALPGLDAPWGAVYRRAPVQRYEPPSDERAVRSAAVELLRAEGAVDASDVLGRAEVEVADVPSSGEVPLRRWVVRLAAADAAAVTTDPSLGEAIRRAVGLAATRSREIVAAVELSVA
jgi:hypothetical protein